MVPNSYKFFQFSLKRASYHVLFKVSLNNVLGMLCYFFFFFIIYSQCFIITLFFTTVFFKSIFRLSLCETLFSCLSTVLVRVVLVFHANDFGQSDYSEAVIQFSFQVGMIHSSGFHTKAHQCQLSIANHSSPLAEKVLSSNLRELFQVYGKPAV